MLLLYRVLLIPFLVHLLICFCLSNINDLGRKVGCDKARRFVLNFVFSFFNALLYKVSLFGIFLPLCLLILFNIYVSWKTLMIGVIHLQQYLHVLVVLFLC